MEFVCCYVTCASAEEATRIARAVVEARLAACANLLPGLTSIYHWQGRIESGSETALLLKTRADLVGPLGERIKALHSYSVPCIVALPIIGGNPDYLAWLAAETRLPEAAASERTSEAP